MTDWENIDDLQGAIFELNNFLNVNEPVRASRVLERIQIYLDKMNKYENGLNVNLEIWNVAMLTAIANELAETNRLTRLVMNRNENYSDEEDGA